MAPRSCSPDTLHSLSCMKENMCYLLTKGTEGPEENCWVVLCFYIYTRYKKRYSSCHLNWDEKEEIITPKLAAGETAHERGGWRRGERPRSRTKCSFSADGGGGRRRGTPVYTASVWFSAHAWGRPTCLPNTGHEEEAEPLTPQLPREQPWSLGDHPTGQLSRGRTGLRSPSTRLLLRRRG